MAGAQKNFRATLAPGDGIGREVTAATLEVLDALGAPFQWETHVAGMAGVQAAGDPLPKETLESIRKTRLALKGPLATPVGGGFRSSNVRLREEFQLYANLRPARTLVPGGRYENIPPDEIRGVVGGLGMAPAANLGLDAAIFEAVHGSAPDIAGKGVANPLALMLSAAMMLDHVGHPDKATRMREAIDKVLREDNVRTRDLGGKAGTKEFTEAIVKRVK